MNIDQILEKFDLSYSELTSSERDTLDQMLSAMSQQPLTVERLKDYIHAMRDGIEQELTKETDVPTNWLTWLGFFIPFVAIIRKFYADRRDLALKARLRNLVLLEAFLMSPQRARQQLEDAIQNIKPRR